MTPDVFILPGLAFLFGVISLFIDPKEIKSRNLRWGIFGSILAILFLVFVFSVQSNDEAQDAQENAEKQRQRLSDSLQSTEDQLSNAKQQRQSLIASLRRVTLLAQKVDSDQQQVVLNTETILATLRAGGFILQDSDRIEQSLEASSIIEQQAELISDSAERRSSITIQYFPKDVDKNVVEGNLTKLGFNLVPGTPNFQAPTNSIWFGQDVVTDDVKLIALTLIRAGVQIQAIRPFRNSAGSKATLVQVGSDLDVSCNSWTASAIEDASSFTRSNNGCMF